MKKFLQKSSSNAEPKRLESGPLENKAGVQCDGNDKRDTPEAFVCPESTIESAKRRNFIKQAALVTAAAGIGGVLLGKSLIPESSASSALVSVTTPGCNKSGRLAVWNGSAEITECKPASLTACSICTILHVRNTGTGYGIRGCAVCGVGVCGHSDTKAGVYGSSLTKYGVHGCSPIIGVLGSGCYGVQGCGRIGVYGTGKCIGVEGKGEGCGVFGCATSSLGFGVRGVATCGAGVVGAASNNLGVCGFGGKIGVAGSGGKIGVLGYAASCEAIPLVARAFAGQKANLQQWENSSCTPLSVVNSTGWFGIQTSTPQTTLQVKGGISLELKTELSCYSMGTSDFAVLANPSATGKAITLPAAKYTGMVVYVKNISTAEAVTVKPSGTDSIEVGGTLYTSSSPYSLAKDYNSLTLIAGGGSPGTWYNLSTSM